MDSAMTPLQLNRLVDLLERWIVLQEKRLEKEFPPAPEIEDAQVVRVGEDYVDQPESREEYDDFPIDQPTSFQTLLTKLKESA
jgi:hypothetical protein